MPPEVINFIQSQFVSVLAVEMLDGRPHAATVHYAFSEEPLMFLFETYKPYMKSEALFGRPSSRASLVIGNNESDRKTLQIDGEVSLIKSTGEEKIFRKIYFDRFPKKKEKANDPNFVFFYMLPRWWRFTDWEAPGGKKILTSEDHTK